MTISQSATGEKNGNDNLAPEHYAAFADYLVAVVQHFKKDWGVQFDSLEPLNEPDGHWWKYGNHQEGCYFEQSSQDALLAVVGQRLKASGSKTILSAPDSNSIDNAVSAYRSFSQATKALISRINTHSYGGSQRKALYELALADHKGLWMSEYGDGDASGMDLAHRIVEDIRGLKPTAWVFWQVVDGGGGWGCLSAPLNNDTDTSYTVNKKYYAYESFTRFIRPGSRFIGIDDTDSIAAYDHNRGTLAIVLVGTKADRQESVDLSKFARLPKSAELYRTSRAEDLVHLDALPITNRTLTVTVPAQSIVSVSMNEVW
jgi:O-glycosyl hydrolase